MFITDILLTGAENAQSGKELADRLGMTIRDFTEKIAHERRCGHPICASQGENKGYYLAANREEMERYCRSLERREDELRKTREACMAAAKKLR